MLSSRVSGARSARIPAASVDSVAEWDSMAQITLLSLIGEEFGIDIDFEEFEGAVSFTDILARVQQRTDGSR